jgi:hypothetical protein
MDEGLTQTLLPVVVAERQHCVVVCLRNDPQLSHADPYTAIAPSALPRTPAPRLWSPSGPQALVTAWHLILPILDTKWPLICRFSADQRPPRLSGRQDLNLRPLDPQSLKAPAACSHPFSQVNNQRTRPSKGVRASPLPDHVARLATRRTATTTSPWS